MAEHTPFGGIWVGEDIGRIGDVFVQASVASLNAPTKKIGIGITSPLVRNISTIARAAAALRELDPTMFRLGLGVGGLHDLQKLGIRLRNPASTLTDATQALREIWAGKVLTFKAQSLVLDRFQARYQPESNIPIYLGVRGPRLLQLAGRIADGVILSGPLPYLEEVVSIIRNELTRHGRARNFSIVIWLPTLIVHNIRDQELAKLVAATVIADAPKAVIDMADISDLAIEHVQTAAKNGGYQAAAKLVSAELLDIFTVSGNADHIVDVFESLAKLGADEVVFGPPYGSSIDNSINEVVEAWGRS